MLALPTAPAGAGVTQATGRVWFAARRRDQPRADHGVSNRLELDEIAFPPACRLQLPPHGLGQGQPALDDLDGVSGHGPTTVSGRSGGVGGTSAHPPHAPSDEHRSGIEHGPPVCTQCRQEPATASTGLS